MNEQEQQRFDEIKAATDQYLAEQKAGIVRPKIVDYITLLPKQPSSDHDYSALWPQIRDMAKNWKVDYKLGVLINKTEK